MAWAPSSWQNCRGEDRDAAGAEQQHPVTRLDPASLDQRVPGGERGARQGRGLFEGEALRDRQRAPGGENDLLGQDAVARSAERAGHGREAAGAVVPVLEEAGEHAVAGCEAGHARADGDHLAGAV